MPSAPASSRTLKLEEELIACPAILVQGVAERFERLALFRLAALHPLVEQAAQASGVSVWPARFVRPLGRGVLFPNQCGRGTV